jgi:hypothetical protein
MQPYVNGGESTFWVDDVRLLGVIPVELSDGYTQQAPPGETVTYDHVLQNFHWTTDTIGVEAVSENNWPLTLVVGGVSSTPGTVYVPVQLGSGMTTTVQVSVTVPMATIGMTDTIVVTATSLTQPPGTGTMQPRYFDTLEDVVEVAQDTFAVYLPLVLRIAPTP